MRSKFAKPLRTGPQLWCRVSQCLGGVRISTVHANRNCRFLNRKDAVGTVLDLDLAALPDVIAETLPMCQYCGGLDAARV